MTIKSLEIYGLANTGWINRPYGIGERISIGHTRAIIRAILTGKLKKAKYETEARRLADTFENVYLDFGKNDETKKETAIA